MNRNRNERSERENGYAYIVPAVDRAARILALLRKEKRGMTIAEVTEATGWHKSSVHKILVTLNHHGLLERDEKTKSYSLGFVLVEYGQFILSRIDWRREARSFLEELADFSRETANFSILRGTKVITADTVESPDALRVSPPIGTADSLTTKSSGKAILAFFPEDQIARIIKNEGLPALTKNSITDPEAFQMELAAVREQGYAADFEEFQEGVNAVSAAIFNGRNRVVGALTLVGPSFRMTRDKMRRYGKKCSDAAARLSSILRSS